MRIPPLLGLNPELQRNLWLELSWTRLVAMPVGLLVLLGGIHSVSGADSAATWAKLAMGALLLFWGSRLAADSFGEEVSGRTWDVQRLSALNPWGVALGKFFGGTSYAWYGGLLCALALGLFKPEIATDTVLRLVVAGLTAQGVALLMVLVLYQFSSATSRGHTTLAQLIGFGAGLFVNTTQQGAVGNVIRWYGTSYPSSIFLMVLELTFVAWLVVAIMRRIRRELGYIDGPAAWVLFNIYVIAVALGFPRDQQLPEYPQLAFQTIVAAVCAALAYVGLAATPASSVALRRLTAALRARRPAAIWRDLPIWVPSAAGAAVVVILLSFEAMLTGDFFVGPTFLLAGLGFLARDVGIVYLVRLSYRRRTTLGLLILYGILYGLAPTMFTGIGRQLFVPIMGPGSIGVGFVLPWIEATIVAALLARKIAAKPAS